MLAMTAELLRLYPVLASIPEAELVALFQQNALIKAPAGAQLFSERQPCGGFPVLLEGSIKVIKTTPQGREMVLYRVEPGGTCIISSSCLLGQTSYSAQGVAESPLTLLMLPKPLFDRLLASSDAFRNFVFQLFAERIAELMGLVEEVAFARLDQRLARLLLGRQQNIIHTTHQQLAEELGSVREIVSRLLKGLATQGFVALGREQITVLNKQGLAQLAEMTH